MPKKKASVKRASRVNVKVVTYACNTFCSPNDRHKHLNPGDILVMFAENITAKITFTAGSPFTSGITVIRIPKEQAHAEVVGRHPSGTRFPYTLTCTGPVCAALDDPPEMIVD